jgi:hypothetical protein
MTTISPEERFRKAAEAEGGMPISAGARVAHVRLAMESGRAFYVDLSAVPVDRRPAVVDEIKELVKRASTQATQENVGPVPKSSEMSG